MEYNIFSMFYPLHRTYPNIFTIFGSAHNFLHKIKHNLNLHKKEKEKRHCAAGGPAAWPAGRPICSANALRAPSPPSSRRRWQRAPAVSIVPHLAGGSVVLPAAAGGVPALATKHSDFASPSRPRWPCLRACYPLSLPWPHTWRTAALAARRPATRAQ